MPKWFSKFAASSLPTSRVPGPKAPGGNKAPGGGKGGKGRGGFSGSSPFTWHPTDKGANVTLTGDNLILTKTAAGTTNNYAKGIRGATGSGKFYWETVITNEGFGSNSPFSGVADWATYNGSAVPVVAGCWLLYFANTGGTWIMRNGTAVTTWATTIYAEGDTINHAIDIAAGKMWFGKNGVWTNSGDPDAGTGGMITTTIPNNVELRPLGWVRVTGDILTARFAESSWAYAKPSASTFSAWS